MSSWMWHTWIFHLNKYLIFALNHLKQSPFCCSSGNMCMQCTWFYPHFSVPASLPPYPLSLSPSFPPSHTQSRSLFLSLSVSWTSCSVALKYGTLCRSVDHRSALHPESECNVNDMMIPSKATLTLLSFKLFQVQRLTSWDNEVNSKAHFNVVVVLADEHTIMKTISEQSRLKRGNSIST